MQNITITLDEQAAAWARVRAAERNISLSRFVGEMIHKQMGHSGTYQTAMRVALARKPLKLEGPYLKRDELYDRSRLR